MSRLTYLLIHDLILFTKPARCSLLLTERGAFVELVSWQPRQTVRITRRRSDALSTDVFQRLAVRIVDQRILRINDIKVNNVIHHNYGLLKKKIFS